VNFQQSLGAVFGLWMLTEVPIDHRLALGDARVVTIRMETEAPLDDALALTSDGGVIAAQAKNHLSLSSALQSDFGKTVEQIVRQWRLCHDGAGDLGWNRPLDRAKDRLVIAVGTGSPATMRVHLARGLEARRQPGPPLLTADETRAMGQFDACIRLAWSASTTEPLTKGVLLAISHLTFVYTIDPDGADRAALAVALGPALASPRDGPSVLNLLERIAGDLMSTRGGRDISQLRSDLIGRGAKLAARPDYRDDIAALAAYSLQTEQTLRALEVVEPEAGIPVGIVRHCQPAVNAATLGGNLLLIGEPGAGKSAVINALGRALRSQGHDVVELAVDRFSIESLEGLSRTLRLRHDLPVILGAWDGPAPAFLLIDALDASRGGPAEAAFKRLIAAVIEQGSRWIVVASIRTFDLRLGQSFRALFKGTPPDRTLQEESFPLVRHIRVPPWSELEFEQLLDQSPRLAAVLRHSPAKLRELAMVPFNTRLLAELIASGAMSDDFTSVDSQIALLDLYWERRVEHHGAAGEVCLRAVVTEMVNHHALRAPRMAVAAANPIALDALTGEGVLISTDQQRSIQFRHHLLFDYVASRVFLDPDAVMSGQAIFPKAGGLGLILAPAMSFLLLGLWSSDPGHVRFWTAVSQLLGASDCDPVIRSTTARMAAELPSEPGDIMPFASAVGGEDPKGIAALPHVAGAVAVRLEDDPTTPLTPWVNLELELSRNPAPVAGVLRMLGYMLVDRVKDAGLRANLGTAVRALLAHGYTLSDSRSLATPAIGFVADTIATDVQASVRLLGQVLTDRRFESFGSEELPALSRKINAIAPIAPDFAADVYGAVYTRQVTEDRQTSMGGGRILNLTSNARQDFESARWSLSEYFPNFLAASPVTATKALLAAMSGYVARQHPIPEGLDERTISGPNGDVRLQPDHSHIWAHEVHPQSAEDADALLSKFETFLETGEEGSVIPAADHAVRHATLAVVWSRLFMAAAARGGALADLLGPYALRLAFIISPDTRKDAIDLVAARYDALTEADRAAFETEAMEVGLDTFAHPMEARQRLLRRLFGAIGLDRLTTQEAHQMLADLSTGEEINPRLFRLTGEAIEPETYYWMDQTTRATQEVVDMIGALEAACDELHLNLNDNQPLATLDDAISVLMDLRRQIDAGAVSDAALNSRAEGTFAQGVHKLIQSELVDADTPAEAVAAIVKWIEAACSSSYPETDTDTEASFERSQAWGSPSARLEGAAAALDLCLKRPETYGSLEPIIDRMLIDPHPAVRMNAAAHLVRIWELDRHGFWKRAARIVATEDNRSVLDSFVTARLGNLMWHGAAREVADLVLPLADRLPVSESRNATIRKHLVQMTLLFWLRFDFQDADARVRSWFADSVDNVEVVREAIQWLRNDYTAGLRGQADPAAPEKRRLTIDVLAQAVQQAADELTSYSDFAGLNEGLKARAQSAMRIIDMACQQLYFSSGAFQHAHQQDARTPLAAEDAEIFFREIAPTLRRIGQHGGPHTIYYLIQLLEHILEADPAGVFDIVAFAVLHGRQGGYEYESLGADLMVKLVGRYLADHKEIFDDPQLRAALVDTLEAFVAAGWPSARRLFYRKRCERPTSKKFE
jgi:hypothetical protein